MIPLTYKSSNLAHAVVKIPINMLVTLFSSSYSYLHLKTTSTRSSFKIQKGHAFQYQLLVNSVISLSVLIAK